MVQSLWMTLKGQPLGEFETKPRKISDKVREKSIYHRKCIANQLRIMQHRKMGGKDIICFVCTQSQLMITNNDMF